MSTLIVGHGIQGRKRKKILKKNFFGSFDPYLKDSDFKKIKKLNYQKFKNVFICTPDSSKLSLSKFFLMKNKNVLIEKPFLPKKVSEIIKIYNIAKKFNKIFYVAYNHRFEPNLVRAKKILKKKSLGKIYYCRIFYGNGTAKLVKNSTWKDKKKGVLTDLGSHLVDLCFFLFKKKFKFEKIKKNKFENVSTDHAILHTKNSKIYINLEMTLCSWKNTFLLDVIGSKGSLHINNLCKWGESTLILRKRKFPSGVPVEKIYKEKKGDPTWKKEHDYFFSLIKNKNYQNPKKDILIFNTLNNI